MSRGRRPLADYPAHILEAIGRIDRYAADMNQAAFRESRLVPDAVIRTIEVIGEAGNNVEKRYPGFAAAQRAWQ